MTATALRGRHSTDPRRPERATHPMRDIHPDVLAVARDMDVTRPRTIAHFQRIYDQMIDASIEGLHAYVLTYVDPSGERATHEVLRKQMKERR